MYSNKTNNIKLDERNHVEKPLLDQLAGLGWEIIDPTDEIPRSQYKMLGANIPGVSR